VKKGAALLASMMYVAYNTNITIFTWTYMKERYRKIKNPN